MDTQNETTREIVINTCFGGFGLSKKAQQRLKELGVTKCYYNIARDDPSLIQVVKELGKDANDGGAKLKIVIIPANVEWRIHDYDGLEHVEEKHRTWF